MKSWIDLEERFRAIVVPLRQLRIDYSWGASGEHWRLCGMQHNADVLQFEILAGIAGMMLAKCGAGQEASSEAASQKLWYKTLKEFSGGFQDLPTAQQFDDAGNFAGNIFMGRIEGVVEVSANLCLRLNALYPYKEEIGTVNINVSGGNIGILNAGQIKNVQSISVNVSSIRESGQTEFAEAVTQY